GTFDYRYSVFLKKQVSLQDTLHETTLLLLPTRYSYGILNKNNKKPDSLKLSGLILLRIEII
ncbi:MAG TPA: hypothetical protein VFQ56_07415, partial [Flavobacterium sp.]|nr:hypothetical protein [Flavobacterium sp.]